MLKVAFLVVMSVYALPVPATASEQDAQPVEAVMEALEAWAAFTTQGHADLLGDFFDRRGPQWAELVDEPPLGVPPLTMTPIETIVRSQDSTAATVWARIRVTREGYRPRQVAWDFDLIAFDDGWQVWAVVPAERPVEPETDAGEPAIATTSTTDTAEAMDTSGTSTVVAVEPSRLMRQTSTRVPVLSAWILVLTLAGVAGAGYLAPWWEGRRER